MILTRRILLLAACCSIAWPCAAGEPFRVLKAGDARLTLLRDGRFSLACGGAVLIADARLVVAAARWKGSASQAAGRVRKGYPSQDARAACVFRGEIEEAVSKTTWRFAQRVRAEKGGFHFLYEIQPLTDADAGEVCLFLDLPLDRWRGGRVLLWPRAEAAFPDKQPRDRHFLSAVARRAVLATAGGRRVSLRFTRPALCTVQDMREYGGRLFQLYPRLFRGGRRKGQTFVLEFTLMPDDQQKTPMPSTDYSATAALRAGPVKLPAARAAVGKRFEIDLDVAGTWKTPFDPDEIRVDGHVRMPSGRQVVVPAFFYQSFELSQTDGETWLEPKGRPTWKLRFAATEAGAHSIYVTAKDRSGEARSQAATFEAVASDSPGYVRVSRDDPRYFAFDSGRPYFAVGENVCTWRKSVTDYDRWFARLGRARANYARIWMWASCFGIEWGRPGEYRLGSAWELDHAMALAEKHGIYVKLCLEAWRGFSGPRSFVRAGVLHPYAKPNGGPCEKEMDVFTHPEARRMFRNRLRYVVARWGYSPHILAWEFWNEINCVRGYRDRSADVIRWTAEMGRYLKKIDPWGHLVVNSLGSFQVDDRLWKLPEMDFAQVHGYWHPTLAASKETGKDMAEMVPHWIGRIRGHGKPALFAEYGLVNPRWGHSPRADEDTGGVHLHNGLWSSVMSGAAGTAMLWWWGNYVDPNDLYYHFAAVARFVEHVPWTTARFQPAKIEASSPDLRAMGLRGRKTVLLWLQNRRHTWWNVVEKRPVGEVKSAAVTVTGLTDGPHDVEWWDTWKGTVTKRQRLEARQGRLSLDVAGLQRDVAVKILRQ